MRDPAAVGAHARGTAARAEADANYHACALLRRSALGAGFGGFFRALWLWIALWDQAFTSGVAHLSGSRSGILGLE